MRVTQLRSLEVQAPAALASEVLPRLLSPDSYADAPHWLDLSLYSGDEWQAARLNFLARLNEQREKLRRTLSRPLILILPASEREQVKALVPDLWAIRDLSLDSSAELLATTATTVPEQEPPADLAAMAEFPFTEYEQSQLAEWERASAKGGMERGVLLAGDAALAACLRRGRYAKAGQIAEASLSIARALRAAVGETPEALRDLSISLDNVGRVAQALGRWQAAAQVYEESLQIRRDVRAAVGETPEALRDLSISLNNVGRVAEALGRWEAAAQAYEEGLQISRDVRAAVGETPEALRDLSVSLDKVGGVAEALGQWQAARNAYDEGLRIAAALCRAFPDMDNYHQLRSHFEQRLAQLAP